MITLQDKKNKIDELANKYASSQIDKYKDSIFFPYITLSNAKGKGTMMEEYFNWFLNENGIKSEWIRTNDNYDFMVNDHIRIELKVASIGHNGIVVFNQLHFGKGRNVDKFLFAIIKPDDDVDFFLMDKTDFIDGNIKLQNQHTSDKSQCARMCMPYDKMVAELENYRVDIDRLRKIL